MNDKRRYHSRLEAIEFGKEGFLQIAPQKLWWARPDSNREPADYESDALTD